MFWSKTIKQIKKELKKIAGAFRLRDEKIFNNQERINKLEGSLVILMSQSQPVSQSLTKSQSKIETKIIRRLRKSKKSIVMAEINKLMPSSSVIEIYDVVVNEKGLCSKASFYRYIQSLKSQKLNETETKLRLKNK